MPRRRMITFTSKPVRAVVERAVLRLEFDE
jgi:hypothetical protein